MMMELDADVLIISFSIIILSLLVVLKNLVWKQKNLPPGPRALPILGHLHLLLKGPIHENLNALSDKYGPTMLLRFGFRNALILSSPAAVEECFTNKNDINFANRPRLLIFKHLNYNYTSVGAAPYGQLWRNLRRVMSQEFLSFSHLNSTSSIRQDEARLLVEGIMKGCCGSGTGCDPIPGKVDLKARFIQFTTNIITRMTMGKSFYGENMADAEEAKKFDEILTEFFVLFRLSNLGDFLTLFRWVDVQGTERRMLALKDKVDNFIDHVIAQRRQTFTTTSSTDHEPTLIDRLLVFQEKEPEFYTQDILRGIILVILLGGAESSFTTMEWAMALLLNHPDAKEKVRREIEVEVGRGRPIEEKDLRKLCYLQNVIDETLRLYPPGALLIPREASEDCRVGGFDVPRGTMLLANIWAIHRDPKVWSDPQLFLPERHQAGSGNTTAGGAEGYYWIPFGSGRRGCPGNGLAYRMIPLALASLIQSFDWERVIASQQIDMTADPGSIFAKLKPLEAICKPRPLLNSSD